MDWEQFAVGCVGTSECSGIDWNWKERWVGQHAREFFGDKTQPVGKLQGYQSDWNIYLVSVPTEFSSFGFFPRNTKQGSYGTTSTTREPDTT